MNDCFTPRKDGFNYDPSNAPWLFYDGIDVSLHELNEHIYSVLLNNKMIDVDLLMDELDGNVTPEKVQVMSQNGWATKRDIEHCLFDAPDLEYAVRYFIMSLELAHKSWRSQQELKTI
ncbi:hypothetical protein V5T82_13610 [Magnetovibrio sp. PR-2]|uniref:hypothetical protein n=1 Tax=Magnetovibrio sp. PR-2 TaxID=3120356 RepID=UPI002FCE08ED